jgi:hypothetical protein
MQSLGCHAETNRSGKMPLQVRQAALAAERRNDHQLAIGER